MNQSTPPLQLSLDFSTVPYGYCHCGCGQETPPIENTRRAFGRVKGEPSLFCKGHWMRLKEQPLRGRFWAKVTRNNPHGCWLWQEGLTVDGYGKFWVRGASVAAHRFSYTETYGPLPPDKPYVLHRCDVHYAVADITYRRCVRPDHLEAGTNADNMRQMAERGRAATGDRSGARIHPETRARGDRSGARLHPGRRPRGVAHWCAKLTDDDVLRIRALARDAHMDYHQLAAMFNMTPENASIIVRRKSWKHLP